VSCNFVANYYGGTGNDLVLQWAGLAARIWGSQSFFLQDPVPPFVKIAAGESHTVALKSDGTVAAWGDNAYGQTTVPDALNGMVAIAAGGAHTAALIPLKPYVLPAAASSITATGVAITGRTNPNWPAHHAAGGI
jgi:hypothetical protein